MARRDLSNKDYSRYASSELEYVLQRQSDEVKLAVPTVTAAQAMAEERLVQHKSQRDITRVLFVSGNTDLLNPTTQSLDGYLNISDVFDEVHILILRTGIEPRQPVIRPEDNVFIYTVATRYWWQLPWAGIEMIKSQLAFADGFRPDLIVARDAFESALVALWAVRRYGRPAQLHVLQNYFHDSFLADNTSNRWRRWVAWYTVPRFWSIRASTTRIMDRLRDKTDIDDLARLPQFNPYESISATDQTLYFEKKYPQYGFFILFIGSLQDPAAALAAIDASRYMLRNSRIALVIMGDGVGRSQCEARVRALGIEEQVIFEHHSIDRVQYLKAADLLIVTNTDDDSEEVTLQAAAAGLPMVMVRTERRDDMFTHLQSAYMCEADDIQSHSDGVHELMEKYGLRQRIAASAAQVVSQALHQDVDEYSHVYRTSIEAALFAQPTDSTESGDSEDIQADPPAV